MDDTTTAIKQAVDIVAVIGETVHLEPNGSKFRGLCPFHDDHKPSFTVDPEYQSYRCWACGAKGDVFTFLQESEKLSFVEAKQRLAEKAGISLQGHNANRSDPRQSLYRVLAWAQQEYQNCLWDPRLGQEARQYLDERGLSEQTAREFGLGAAPDAYEWLIQRAKRAGIEGKLLIQAGLAKMGNRPTPYDAFRGRLMFPIKDARGRVVAFGGRILPRFANEFAPKYINSPATDVYQKSDVLFGLEVAKEHLQRATRDNAEKMLVVMEGYMDCLMAYQHGLRNVVATCGTALTASHVSKLRAHATSAVLMFDGDQAGQKAARESVHLFLTAELDVRVCLLPDNLDPCDLLLRDGLAAMQRTLANAPDALEFQIQQALANHDVRTVDGQHAALEQVLSALCAVPVLPRGAQATKYQLALTRLAQRFGVSEQVLRQRITELRQGNRGNNTRNIRGSGPVANPGAVADSPAARERTAVSLIVCRPHACGEIRNLLPPDAISHPDLRNILQACYALYDRVGDAISVDQLREFLGDARLGTVVLELCEHALDDNAWQRAFSDLKINLVGWQRRKMQQLTGQQLSPQASDEDHLQVLRQLRERNAL